MSYLQSKCLEASCAQLLRYWKAGGPAQKWWGKRHLACTSHLAPFPTSPDAEVQAPPSTCFSAEAGSQPPWQIPGTSQGLSSSSLHPSQLQKALFKPRLEYPRVTNLAESSYHFLTCFSKAYNVTKCQQILAGPISKARSIYN